MREFPFELIYFAIFVALFLYQYIRKALTRQAQREAAAEALSAEPVPSPVSFESLRVQQPATPPAWSAAPITASDFGRRLPAPARARPQRRFSRQSLFGTRQDVQKGVVIATILGPCRALDPAGGDGPAQRVRGVPPRR